MGEMAALIGTLLTWVHMTAGYTVPDTLPKVEFVPHRHIVDVMCNGVECNTVGMYLLGDTIYLDEALDVERDLRATSILLHELVHYVQVQAGRFPNPDCATWLTLEREAYALQALWLRQRGVFHPMRVRLPGPEACALGASPPDS
jgi:hypothetical protein